MLGIINTAFQYCCHSVCYCNVQAYKLQAFKAATWFVHTHTSAVVAAHYSESWTLRRALCCYSFSTWDETLLLLRPAAYHRHRCQPRPASRPPLSSSLLPSKMAPAVTVFMTTKSAGNPQYLTRTVQLWEGAAFRHLSLALSIIIGTVMCRRLMRSKCGSGGDDSGLGAWGPGSGTAPARCALPRALRRCVSV